MFKKRWVPFFLAITLGVFFWVVDALLDFYIFYSGTFLDLLILDPPRHELYIRAIILGSFAIFGYVVGRYIKEVQEREAQYRGIVHNPTTYICRFTPEARLTFANRAYCEKFGIPQDEVVGQSFLPRIPEADRDFVRQQYLSLTEENPLTTYEHRVFNKEGEIEWQRWTDHALFNEKGDLVEYQSIGYDITDRVQTQEIYRTLVEHSLQGLEIIQGGEIVFANQRLADLSGYTVEELTSLSPEEVRELVHPENRDQVWENMKRRIAGEEVSPKQEFRFLRKDGSVRWVEALANRIRFQGQPAVQVAVLDITERKVSEMALRESEFKYRDLFESAQDIILFLDQNGDILDINPRGEVLSGYSREKLLEMNVIEDLAVPEDRQVLEGVLERVVRGHKVSYDVRWKTKGGEMLHLDGSTTPRFSPEGDFITTRCILRDVTERVQAEESLKESEEKYRQLFQSATDALFLVDEDTLDILDANQTAQEMYGYTREEFLSLKAPDLSAQPDETRGTIQTFSAESDKEGRAEFQVPLRYHKKKDGTVMVVEITVKHLELQGSRVNLSLIRDITERTMLENELRRRKGELESLTARLVEADEAQRRRFARDLHDQVGQTLSLLRFNLDRLKSRIDEEALDKKSMVAKISEAASLVDETSQSIRQVINNLRPPVLDDYGLFAALHWYVDQLENQVEMDMEVQGDSLHPRLPSRDENILYRVTQEALSNVVRHARATRVTVRLKEEKGRVTLEIADNGRGFNPVDVGMEEESRGWGLINMRERAEVIGGSFSIESEKGRGTVVQVMVPRRKRDD